VLLPVTEARVTDATAAAVETVYEVLASPATYLAIVAPAFVDTRTVYEPGLSGVKLTLNA